MQKMKPTNPAKITLKNIKNFFQGWVRYIRFKIANSNNKLIKEGLKDAVVLAPHLEEQFKWRLQVTNPECLKEGKCIHCGCETPMKQMAGEGCEVGCYPDMMEPEEWNLFKKENQIII